MIQSPLPFLLCSTACDGTPHSEQGPVHVCLELVQQPIQNNLNREKAVDPSLSLPYSAAWDSGTLVPDSDNPSLSFFYPYSAAWFSGTLAPDSVSSRPFCLFYSAVWDRGTVAPRPDTGLVSLPYLAGFSPQMVRAVAPSFSPLLGAFGWRDSSRQILRVVVPSLSLSLSSLVSGLA